MTGAPLASPRQADAASPSRGRAPRFSLGFIDVAGSSLASFSLGIFATRTLDGELLGVYALFFTAFLLGAVVPAQLLCVPAEMDAVRGSAEAQFGGLRRLAPWVLATGALTAVVAAVLIGLTVGADRPGFWALTATMVPTSALSPLQDHIRRLCHQAHRSNVAAGMSAVQAAVTLMGLALLGGPGSTRALAPFGALLVANVLSTLLGLSQLRRERLPIDGRPTSLAHLVATGRWLTGAGTAQAAGGLVSLLLVSRLAGVTAAGLCEAVRVLSQPVYVVSTGLMAVLNPVVFRARLQGDHREEARAHRRYVLTLCGTALALVLLASRLNPLNPLEGWFPAAYQQAWLLEVVIFAQLLFHLPLSVVSSLLAQRRVSTAALGQMAGFPPQLLLASTAGIVGAWAYALGFIGAAIGRLAVIGTLQQRDRTAVVLAGDANIRRVRRRTRKGSVMTDPHPIEEPSVLGSVLRHPLVVGLSVVGGLLLGGVGALASAERHEASTELTVQDPRLTSLFQGSPNLDAKRYVADQVALLQSPEVLRDAAGRLSGTRWGEITMRDVESGMAVRSSEASNTITVAFQNPDEAFAAAADEALVVAYLDAAELVTRNEFDNTSNALQNQIDELDTKIATLDKEIASYQDAGATMVDARLDAAVATRGRLYDERSQLSVRLRQVAVDLARNPSGVTRRSTTYTESAASGALRFVLLGGFVGGLAGTGAAYAKARRRRTFEAASEPETLLGLRYLATIPALGRRAPAPTLVRQRESVLEFLATVVEGEARRRRISRFGFVSPSSSSELSPLGTSLQAMLGGGEGPEPAAESTADARSGAAGEAGVDPVTIDLRDAGVVGEDVTRPAPAVTNGSANGSATSGRYGFDDVTAAMRAGSGSRAATATVTAGDWGDDTGAEYGEDDPGDDFEDETDDLADALDGDPARSGGPDDDGPDAGSGPDAGRDEDGHAYNGINGHDGGQDEQAEPAARMPSSFGNGNGSMTQRSDATAVAAGAPPSGEQPEGDTLVLVECPQYADPARTSGNQIDAIVVVVDHGESIAATAEVVRRVQVLGWDLIGYVYVTDRAVG